MDTKEATKRKLQMPHTMIILMGCVIVMAVLTYLLPAGVYERVVNAAGTTVVDPESYHVIENTPVSVLGILKSIPDAFVAAGQIVALTLFSGGAIMVLRRIGVIDIAIENLAIRFEGKGIIVIPVLMFIFALIDSFIGTPELCMVYIPIIMPLMFRLGFDSITGMATVVLGSAAGFSAALTNPFTIAIGQKVCELPLYSGWQFRIMTFVVTLMIGAGYVMHHGRKVLNNPQSSSVYEDDIEKKKHMMDSHPTNRKMTLRQKLAGYYTIIVFGIMIVGIIALKWDVAEMTAMFLAIGIGAGIISGMESKKICIALADGCKDVMMGAIFITLARATYVVMSEGNIVDTIVYYLSGMLSSLPVQLTVIGILAIVTVLNFFVSSGSGKAVMLFPILAPLADICGITRQTAILAYQFGDGFTNMFWPTNGVQGACLGIAEIPWNKWARFYFPLLCMWYFAAIGFLFLAQAIHLGPF